MSQAECLSNRQSQIDAASKRIESLTALIEELEFQIEVLTAEKKLCFDTAQMLKDDIETLSSAKTECLGITQDGIDSLQEAASVSQDCMANGAFYVEQEVGTSNDYAQIGTAAKEFGENQLKDIETDLNNRIDRLTKDKETVWNQFLKKTEELEQKQKELEKAQADLAQAEADLEAALAIDCPPDPPPSEESK